MKNKKFKQMWVSPEFYKAVSIKAAKEGITKIKATALLSKQDFEIQPEKKKKGRKKRSIWNYEVHLKPPKE